MDDWPFDHPWNCAVFTLRQIVDGSSPVLHVSHDADDHDWQFLASEDAREEDLSIVAFGEMLGVDPSVVEIADLPPGWHAWRRAVGALWRREPWPTEADA